MEKSYSTTELLLLLAGNKAVIHVCFAELSLCARALHVSPSGLATTQGVFSIFQKSGQSDLLRGTQLMSVRTMVLKCIHVASDFRVFEKKCITKASS